MILQGMSSEEQRVFQARPPDFQINPTSKPAGTHQRQRVSASSQEWFLFHQRGSFTFTGTCKLGVRTVPLTEDTSRAQRCPFQCLRIPHPRKNVTIKLEKGLFIVGEPELGR